jgi:hypothetical protein
MRMNLACLDWNENVERATTSEYFFQDVRRPDRRTPMKVLTAKSYKFVDDIWTLFLRHLQGQSVFEVQQSHNTDDEDENLSVDGCEMEHITFFDNCSSKALKIFVA